MYVLLPSIDSSVNSIDLNKKDLTSPFTILFMHRQSKHSGERNGNLWRFVGFKANRGLDRLGGVESSVIGRIVPLNVEEWWFFRGSRGVVISVDSISSW
ncbi:hypothetical protein K2173_019130 [Erythroxylum novogranatense]|uniref:Uncharacterized protein n=1 Tax=Erythroxylum novogranatense TaxID=1862640 RepID=A0AAV8SSQ2_9ROSI|nr:hypothetical protein K2173_019130 [Erythroxylum novogranatense]